MCQVSLSLLGVAYDVVLSWPVNLEWGALKSQGLCFLAEKERAGAARSASAVAMAWPPKY